MNKKKKKEAPVETSEELNEEVTGEPAEAEEVKEEAEEPQEPEGKSEIQEANEKYARLFAEFDNFRKRTEKEKSQMYGFGAKDTIEKILPVLDVMEKGLADVPEEKKEDPFVVGMDKVHKLFVQTLEGMGVKPIEAVGKEFNPEFHNAVMHVEDEEAGENIVVEEFQKGYMYKEQVVRFSMVKVAN